MRFWLIVPALIAGVHAEAPVIDARAASIMEALSNRMDGAKQLVFRATVVYDAIRSVGDEEVKVQMSGVVEGGIRRPDRLRMSVRGDAINREVFYDGKTFTLLAPNENLYGQREVDGGIDRALDRVDELAGYVPPLTDFIYTGTWEALKPRIVASRYLGLHTVGGRRTHHILFVQKDVTWQIWVDRELMVPRKLVVTYTDDPTKPQFVAVWDKWDFDAKLADSLFVFTPPKGAVKVDMIPEASK